MSRETEQKDFLQSQGLTRANQMVLAADASFRTYYRIQQDNQSWVLMDAPPTKENTQKFVAIAKYLRGIGVNSPKIFAEDTKNGFLLFEYIQNYQNHQIILIILLGASCNFSLLDI